MSDNYGILTKQKKMMKKAAFSPPSRPWLLSVSYLKSPKPQCLSAFRPLKIRVTTESERSQNGVRTEAEPAKDGPESACCRQRVPIGGAP